MTLRRRIAQLEAHPDAAGKADAVAQDAAAFAQRMARLGARLEGAGEFQDTLKAPPAERYCRALLRKDNATAGALMRDALGGLPCACGAASPDLKPAPAPGPRRQKPQAGAGSLMNFCALRDSSLRPATHPTTPGHRRWNVPCGVGCAVTPQSRMPSRTWRQAAGQSETQGPPRPKAAGACHDPAAAAGTARSPRGRCAGAGGGDALDCRAGAGRAGTLRRAAPV